MKKILFALGLMLGLAACQKTEELSPAPTSPTGGPTNIANSAQTFDATGQKLVAQGTFAGSGRYSASGSVKLYEKEGKQVLVFENFKVDNGPDLRIYLSEDPVASNFVEVSNKVILGTFFAEIPATANLQKQKTVLIWCRAFSVLFAQAELK
jgi:Electron transfer DM13/Prokaryotic membrane lipoprotein lipid attachment site